MKTEVDIIAVRDDGDGSQIPINEENQETASKQDTVLTRDNEIDSIAMAPGECLAGTCFMALMPDNVLKPGFLGHGHGDHNGPQLSFPKIRLSSQDITRWKMAWRTIQSFKFDVRDSVPFRYRKEHNVIKSRCKDLPDLTDILEEFSVTFGFSAAAFIYGGLHALAWFAHFDSSIEQLLWRISACLVMGGVPVLYVLVQVFNKIYYRNHITADSRVYVSDSADSGSESTDYSSDDTDSYQSDSLHRSKAWDVDDLIIYIGVLLILVLLLAYTLARAYLLVECFINLAHLPAGVYDVPRWATYFPHIS